MFCSLYLKGFILLKLVSDHFLSHINAQDPAECSLKTSQLRDGTAYTDILLEFSSASDTSEGNLLAPDAVVGSEVFLVATLVAKSHYKSFVPIQCELIANDVSSTVSLYFVDQKQIVRVENILLESKPLGSPGNYQGHYFRLNPAAFVNSVVRAGTVKATCEFELCIDVPERSAACEFVSVGTRQHQLVIDQPRFDRSATKSNHSTLPVSRAEEDAGFLDGLTDLLPACVDRAAFIGLTTAVAVLLVALLTVNGVLAVKVYRHRHVQFVDTPGRVLNEPSVTVVTRPAVQTPQDQQPELSTVPNDEILPATPPTIPRLFPRISTVTPANRALAARSSNFSRNVSRQRSDGSDEVAYM